MIETNMLELWDSTLLSVKNGLFHLDLISSELYDWMDEQGNISITPADKMKFIERATLSIHSTISAAYKKNPHNLEAKNHLIEFTRMRETKQYSPAEKAKITTLSKKMIIYEMMKQDFSPINKNNDDKQI